MNYLLFTRTIFFCANWGLLPITNSQIPDYKKSGFEMVFVQGGTFVMGGNDNEHTGQGTDECPHEVQIADFSIGKFEMTQADWFEIMGTNPSYFQNCNDCPVEQVSWDNVQMFIQKANIKYKMNYRLPTEEEWEFAARGGVKSKNYKFAGGDNVDEVAWYSGNSNGKPHPIGLLKPNELGIYDMSGNIWEWCDNFKTPYPCDTQGKVLDKKVFYQNDTQGNAFDSRVLRGGTWSNDASSVRVRDRNGRGSYHRLHTLGFRLAK